jgi:hypothetical protein
MFALANLLLTFLVTASLAVNVWFFCGRRSRETARTNHSVLMQGLQSVRELLTVAQGFQSVVDYETSHSLLGMRLPGTKKKFILRYSGRILCGIDLDELRVDYADGPESSRVTLTIPSSRIFDIVMDMKSICVFHQERGIFVAPLTLEEQNREIVRDLECIERNAAHNREMLDRADSNAVLLLESIASCMGFRAKVLVEPPRNALPCPQAPLDCAEQGQEADRNLDGSGTLSPSVPQDAGESAESGESQNDCPSVKENIL